MSVTMEEAQPVEEAAKKKMLIFEDNDYLMKTLENLNKLRKSKQFCDAILQVGSTQDVHEIHAHRVVLASASPYLLDLFAKESQRNGHVSQIKLNGAFDLISFKCLINYAYTSRLEVPPEKLKSVYMTAKKLKMDAAAHHCGQHLIANLSPDNCIGIRAIPELSLDRSLLKKVDSFIRSNIAEVVNSKELLGLPQIQVELLQNSSEEMKATNSSHLCEMVLDWVKQSCQESFQMGFLTEKVHMLYLNKDDSLHDCNDIENGAGQDSELIQDYKKLSRRLSTPMNLGKSSSNSALGTPSKPRNFLFTQEEVDEATANLVIPVEVTEKKIWKIVATSFTGECSIIGLSIMDGNMVVLSIVQRLNMPSSASTSPGESHNGAVERNDKYTLIPPMSSARCAVGTGDLNGKLLVCGGYDRGECLKTVEVYDETENKWTTMKPMKVPRGRFDIAVLDGKVYAIGGCDGSKELNSAEYFDETLNKWIQLPNLPSVRSNAGVCQLDGKIYVIGGWNGQRGITRCDVFDPETANWTSIAPLSTGRYQAGAAAFDGAVYAIGGCDTWSCLNSVEKYDTQTDTWTMVTPMNIPRRGCGVAFFRDQLYVVGGHDGVHSLCTTEIYDPVTNAWRSGPSLTNCRANVGVTVVGDRLFAVGGFNGKAFLNSVEYLDSHANTWNTSVARTISFANNDENEESVLGNNIPTS